MRLHIRSMKIARTGDLLCEDTRETFARLEEFGAQHVKVSRKMDALIVGDGGYSKQPEKAFKKGIPILSEQDLLSLVDRGHFDYDADHARRLLGKRHGPRVFGEVRSLLQRPRAHRSWGRLCVLIDQCAPHEQEMLVDYIEVEMRHWTVDAQLECVAPADWLAQMARGARHAKYRLIRLLDLSSTACQEEHIRPLITHPDLTDVLGVHVHIPHSMSLGSGGHIPLIHDIANASWREQIVELGVHQYNPFGWRPVPSRLLQSVKRLNLLPTAYSSMRQVLAHFVVPLTMFLEHELEWVIMNRAMVEFFGWTLSPGERCEPVEEDGRYEESLEELWAQQRALLERVDSIDLTACDRWLEFSQLFLLESKPRQIKISWPQIMIKPTSKMDLTPLERYAGRYMVRHHMALYEAAHVPFDVRECSLLERIICVVDDRARELSDEEAMALLARMHLPSTVERVELRGDVDDRLIRWFCQVHGDKVVAE